MVNNNESETGIEAPIEKAPEEEKEARPMDSSLYGLEVGSVGRAFHDEFANEQAMMMPEINLPPEKKVEYQRKERVLRYFQDRVYGMREKNGDWIRLKIKAGKEGLNKADRKKLLTLTDYAEKAAWHETELKFGDAIPEALTKKVKAILGPEKDFSLRAAIVREGLPERSGLLKREKGVRVQEANKQVRFIKHELNVGTEEGIKKDIKKQQRAADQEETEETEEES
jgi:hypothetical protein